MITKVVNKSIDIVKKFCIKFSVATVISDPERTDSLGKADYLALPFILFFYFYFLFLFFWND